VKQTEIKWRFEFPSDIQAERETILAALDRAMTERSPEAVREAGALAWAWVARHPEDYAVWDAGEPVAMLADALGVRASDSQAPPQPRALAGTAAPD